MLTAERNVYLLAARLDIEIATLLAFGELDLVVSLLGVNDDAILVRSALDFLVAVLRVDDNTILVRSALDLLAAVFRIDGDAVLVARRLDLFVAVFRVDCHALLVGCDGRFLVAVLRIDGDAILVARRLDFLVAVLGINGDALLVGGDGRFLVAVLRIDGDAVLVARRFDFLVAVLRIDGDAILVARRLDFLVAVLGINGDALLVGRDGRFFVAVLRIDGDAVLVSRRLDFLVAVLGINGDAVLVARRLDFLVAILRIDGDAILVPRRFDFLVAILRVDGHALLVGRDGRFFVAVLRVDGDAVFVARRLDFLVAVLGVDGHALLVGGDAGFFVAILAGDGDAVLVPRRLDFLVTVLRVDGDSVLVRRDGRFFVAILAGDGDAVLVPRRLDFLVTVLRVDRNAVFVPGDGDVLVPVFDVELRTVFVDVELRVDISNLEFGRDGRTTASAATAARTRTAARTCTTASATSRVSAITGALTALGATLCRACLPTFALCTLRRRRSSTTTAAAAIPITLEAEDGLVAGFLESRATKLSGRVDVAMANANDVVLALEAIVGNVDRHDFARLHAGRAVAHRFTGDVVHQPLFEDRLGDRVGLFFFVNRTLDFERFGLGLGQGPKVGARGSGSHNFLLLAGIPTARRHLLELIDVRQTRLEANQRRVAALLPHEATTGVLVRAALLEVERRLLDTHLIVNSRCALTDELEVCLVVLVNVVVFDLWRAVARSRESGVLRKALYNLLVALLLPGLRLSPLGELDHLVEAANHHARGNVSVVERLDARHVTDEEGASARRGDLHRIALFVLLAVFAVDVLQSDNGHVWLVDVRVRDDLEQIGERYVSATDFAFEICTLAIGHGVLLEPDWSLLHETTASTRRC